MAVKKLHPKLRASFDRGFFLEEPDLSNICGISNHGQRSIEEMPEFVISPVDECYVESSQFRSAIAMNNYKPELLNESIKKIRDTKGVTRALSELSKDEMACLLDGLKKLKFAGTNNPVRTLYRFSELGSSTDGATLTSASSTPQGVSSRSARIAGGLRNILGNKHSVLPRPELREYVDAVRSNPVSADAFFNLGERMIATECIVLDGVQIDQRDCYQAALQIECGHTLANNALQSLDQTVFSTVAYERQLMEWKNAAPWVEASARTKAVKRIRDVLRVEGELASKPDALDLSRLGLTSLPELPPGLTKLDVSYNKLTSLPTLPQGLCDLNAEHNKLAVLPTVQPKMSRLYIRNNRLTRLPALPDQLNTLDVRSNNLTGLPDLPQRLTWLWIGENLRLNIPACFISNSLYCKDAKVGEIRVWQSENPGLVDRGGSPSVMRFLALPSAASGLYQSGSNTSNTADVSPTFEKASSAASVQPLTHDEIDEVRKLLNSGIDIAAFNEWNASFNNSNATLQELIRNADALVSISGSKRLMTLAAAEYDVPETLLDYHRALTQMLESVYTNAQVAAYGLFQHAQSPSLKALGAVSASVPVFGASVLSSLMIAGLQQNIEVHTVNELKKILACFGDSADFLAVTNEVAKIVCIAKQDELEAYEEPERLGGSIHHRAGYNGREVPSSFKLVDVFKETLRGLGMNHQGNLHASQLRRKAIHEVGTLVDAMLGMSDVESKKMQRNRVQWMTEKLGVVSVVGVADKKDPAVAGSSNRLRVGKAAAAPTDMIAEQLLRQLEIEKRDKKELRALVESQGKKINVLLQRLPPQDKFTTSPGRGDGVEMQAQMQELCQANPFDNPQFASVRQQGVVNDDRLNQIVPLLQTLLEEKSAREARDDMYVSKKG